MRRGIIVLAVLGGMLIPTQAEAGKTPPLSMAQGKKIAKQVVHEACRENAGRCRGSRIKDCYSVNKFRVDCTGILLLNGGTCALRVSVIATQGQDVRIATGKIHCG